MWGPIEFVSPWVLGFLISLPVLWWLLRLTPPAPRKIIFPALALLRGLAAREETPAHTPFWILLLRMLIAALVIAAFAEPRLNPEAALPGAGAILIAVDNDWAAARAWNARQEALRGLLDRAGRENRDVILLPTAPNANGDRLQAFGPMAAKSAYGLVSKLAPLPWPADWVQAKTILATIDCDHVAFGVWLNGGLGGADADTFSNTLKSCGDARNARVLSDSETPIYALAPPHGGDDGFAVTRAVADQPALVKVAARGKDGRVLAEAEITFAAGSTRTTGTFNLPPDARNEAARLEIENPRTAAGTALLDAGWQHPAVGIVGDKSEEAAHKLLSGAFYIDRALKPFASIHIGSFAELREGSSILIAPDDAPLDAADIQALSEWIKKGGVFVRFAGEKLAASIDPREAELLPTALRTGDRAMGGAMSWAAPQKLREFPASSPFYGLAIPPDVTISRQVLAEPAADLAQKTWAALADDTPLVTAKKLGRGLTVLFHVPARPEWSSLPLSGLFVDMLRRLAALGGGNGASGGNNDFSTLAPQQTLDAFGEIGPPGPAAQPIASKDFAAATTGPQHPPGFYGSESLTRALNLGDTLAPPEILKNADIQSYRQESHETALAPLLLTAAFVLLLIDFALSLFLRGLIGVPLRRAGALLLLLALMPIKAEAADPVALTSKIYLAYIETGNRETDRVSQAGLDGLARVLVRRTSLDDVGVAGVDPATDDLAFFPLIYWPLTPAALPVTPRAAARVNDYLHHGGMILFDSGANGGEMDPLQTRRLLAGIDLPPLVQIPQNHVLRRSFYLIDSFPGRVAGDELWIESEETASFDGVASVIAGDGNWAAAWAVGDDGRFFFPCEPGGDAQRERAFRFGVNLVMYALTGNYKSDQMHVEALLKRMRK